MNRIRAVGAASAAALAATLLSGGIADAQPAIVGGTTAGPVTWGAQVYVNTAGRPFGGFNCSGTIIAAQWVLTAHHCLDSDGSGMHVKVGSNTLGSGTDVPVDQKKVSPSNDIALLHLTRAVSTGYLKLGSADPTSGTTNQIYGWGRETPTGPPASRLKTANVRVTGSATDNDGGRAIQSTGINGAAWKGDSGGPEIYSGVQVGVASTVYNDGTDPNGTNQYGSVASSRTWIRQTAGV